MYVQPRSQAALLLRGEGGQYYVEIGEYVDDVDLQEPGMQQLSD